MHNNTFNSIFIQKSVLLYLLPTNNKHIKPIILNTQNNDLQQLTDETLKL